MKFLFASDSFKGTLTSRRTAELLTQAAGEIFPGCICDSIEIADGGEGTADAVLSATDGRKIYMTVSGPLMERIPRFICAAGQDTRCHGNGCSLGTASCSRGKNVTQGRPQPSEPAR